MKILLSMLGVLALSPTLAEEHESIVERAFEALDNDFQESWAYTETSTQEDVVYVANYDPRLPDNERWLLVTVDDRPPNDDEAESFLEQKLQRNGDNPDDDEETEDIGVTIQPDTLSLIEETEDYWLFSFVPDDEDEDFMRHIDGTLKVIKDGHYVEYVSLKNEAPIKPAIGVKINTFNSHLTFGPAAKDGPIVPKSVDVHVQGRAFLAVKFDETEIFRFGDFEYVGEL